ncbi:DEAD/DEAH box helicase family protein [Planococcus sp. APC 4015]|nr:DEAD/DEAH box helicase family protein [Planococcus sp. APC 4015]
MSWPELVEPALQEYVYTQQGAALAAYESDPDLIEEHVRQEDSYRVGGYGTRQVSELLQNAVDALSEGGEPGRVEFRIADGALYCANGGAPFGRKGLRAVTHAFLSGKREDEIGRFGLGFKSVLGITSHPQVFSRSVSFEFNPDRTRELLSDIPAPGGRLPLLRVPSLLDPKSDAAQDPHLAELMEWATTVVKLPLQREGARIRAELTTGFRAESLVFLNAISEFVVSAAQADGTLTRAVYGREPAEDGRTITLRLPDGSAVEWLYAERSHEPSEAVAASLPETARRKSMTVSYAVNPLKRFENGQLWAWFPLQDKTTAGGLFNAPWQVNDDRTTLLLDSTLNRELLDISTELFLDVVTRASVAGDPAAHLDLFPARGREVRSPADRYLSSSIPAAARNRPMIPDLTGTLRSPNEIPALPDLETYRLSAGAVEVWARATERTDLPHPSCFSTDTRLTRLRGLLIGDEARPRPAIALAEWVSAAAGVGDVTGLRAALRLVTELRGTRGVESLLDDLKLVPTSRGRRASINDRRSVLLPVVGEPAPEGVEYIHAEVAKDEDCRRMLLGLGFHEVSHDEIVIAVASTLTGASDESAWESFWHTARAATLAAAEKAVDSIRSRRVALKVLTQGGAWRNADEVFADVPIAVGLALRHADLEVVPNVALLRAAGCLTGPRIDVIASDEGLFAEYLDHVYSRARKELSARRVAVGRADVERVLEDQRGAGPVSLLAEITDDQDRTKWSDEVVRLLRRHEVAIDIPLPGRMGSHTMVVQPLETWALTAYGMLTTTKGARRPSELVGPGLRRFGSFLPVATMEVARPFRAPEELRAVSDSSLLEFLGEVDYPAFDKGPFAELLNECAGRASIARPELIPAIRGGRVVAVPAREVVVADPDEVELVEQMGWSYIPSHDGTAVIERWGLDTAQVALAKTIDAVGVGSPIALDELHPSLRSIVAKRTAGVAVAPAEALFQVVSGGPRGSLRTRVESTLREDGTVLVDESLDESARLSAISRELDLGLSRYDVEKVLVADDELRRSEVLARAVAAKSHADRLLVLVGVDVLKKELPRGLLEAVTTSAGEQSDRQIAELFLRAQGSDSVRVLRDYLKDAGILVPRAWDGSDQAQALVKRLGFSTSFAGEREVKPPRVTQVQGKITLNELHGFQRDLAVQIRDLALASDPERNGHASRGLLYLPTGAGKTRVTAEAILTMLRDGELESPVVWVAQSQELCEQAIQTFAEVWRWLGDERPIDLSRFWSGYELDESNEELQVVVAIDDTLDSRLGEATYSWMTDEASLVVIDEAHTAGDSPTYTRILRHFGLTASQTARPLLGLTATPFKGRNDVINEQFANRFGKKRLNALDVDDPISELRNLRVLAEIDHEVLAGLSYEMDDQGRQMREVSKAMLDRIGSDIARTQLVVDHIAALPEDWPVLVFTPTVAAAHTTAALLQLRGIESDAVDGSMRRQERRRVIERFKGGGSRVLVNCDLLTQGFDAPRVRALYIARPTFAPNRYIQMVGRGLRGPANGGTDRCLVVNVADTFEQFGEQLAYNEFDYLWSKK